MYKTLHGQAAINIPPYVKHKTVMKTRNSDRDPMKFIPVQTSCGEYINTVSGLEQLMTGAVYRQIS